MAITKLVSKVKLSNGLDSSKLPWFRTESNLLKCAEELDLSKASLQTQYTNNIVVMT